MDLIADIGATNARFQFAHDGKLIDSAIRLSTPDFDQCEDLLTAAIAQLAGSCTIELDRAMLAIAGPVHAPGEIVVTNTGLLVQAHRCTQFLDCPTYLANDFFAMAHGVPHFSQLTQIGGSSASRLTKALLGPGTGLGMATLVPNDESLAAGRTASHGWRVVASEGGHADLAPGSHLEAQLWEVLLEAHGHVSWETVVCGRGLENLYRAMASIWGSKAQDYRAADIVKHGQSMADPVCHQTLETFCALLGSAAGNLALTVAARGGVYIGGGIVPRMMEFVMSSPLRRRFEERGDMSDFVKNIPILIIADPEPGLVGAMWCLQTQ